MCKRSSSLSPLIFEFVICLKCIHHVWSLSDVIEANKRRQNESKSLRTKKSVHYAKLENKLKDINEWDDFHAALEDIKESTAVGQFLGSDDDDEEMDRENISQVDSCCKDDSEDIFSEDDSGFARLNVFLIYLFELN